jgi:hypothetical protein
MAAIRLYRESLIAAMAAPTGGRGFKEERDS